MSIKTIKRGDYMGELVSLALFAIRVFLSALTESDNFRNFGRFSTVVTAIAIFLGLASYYASCYENHKLINHDLFPVSFPMKAQDVLRTQRKAFKLCFSTLICYYICISCGLVSIIYLLSTVFRLTQ